MHGAVLYARHRTTLYEPKGTYPQRKLRALIGGRATT